jgi:hypothetical protein
LQQEKGDKMRPTKEMILETKELVNRTQQDIRQIIKKNDMELKAIREKDQTRSGKKFRFFLWPLILIPLILSYLAYRFLFS